MLRMDGEKLEAIARLLLGDGPPRIQPITKKH